MREKSSSSVTSSSQEGKGPQNGGTVGGMASGSTDSGVGKEGHEFPILCPVSKRYSLAVDPTFPVTGMAPSSSLLALPNDPIIQNGGAGESKTETVELKTHLKEREKISVAKEKRAAKVKDRK